MTNDNRLNTNENENVRDFITLSMAFVMNIDWTLKKVLDIYNLFVCSNIGEDAQELINAAIEARKFAYV